VKIELRIERLVLDAEWLGANARDAVADAIRMELAHLLAQPGAADALRTIGAVDALPAVTLAAGAESTRRGAGSTVAQALAGALGISGIGAESAPAPSMGTRSPQLAQHKLIAPPSIETKASVRESAHE
jgi:hypothetical protein